MAFRTSGEHTLSLFELNSLVRQTIEYALDREYWVEAELSECRESRGHCYMELIQYDDATSSALTSRPSPQRVPIARAQARCWRTQWLMLQSMFERATGQQLHAGMKVRLKVYPQFHEAYGFSWIVTDIDPTFTLGDMARRRQEIIAQLKAEGVFDMQKSLDLPLPCLNIAVISSATAAGYGDFVNQLASSPFAFRTQLFPATMQGEQVEQSIIAALDQIYSKLEKKNDKYDCNQPSDSVVSGTHISHLPSFISDFDCVVIIRGGGATADLSGFDTLALAENVAQFPLPIITGIGHDRDESILDMVSHTRVKTPTAAAAFLIDQAQAVLDAIDDAQERLARHTSQKLSTLNAQLSTLTGILPQLFAKLKTRHEARLDSLTSRLGAALRQRIIGDRGKLDSMESRMPIIIDRRLITEMHRLQLLEAKAQSLDPALLLQRGFSITMKDGKAVKDAQNLKPGDKIETRLAKGSITSVVENMASCPSV